MNDEQYKRFIKMKNEDIKCLFKIKDKSNYYFLISGSTGTHYKVAIYNTGKIHCDCPDFKNGAKTQECVCKHCLYVLYFVLKMFKNVDHAFFKRCFFTPDEMETISAIYRELSRK